MSDTKTCNLTESELTQIIIWHGYNLNDEGKSGTQLDIGGDMAERIERINYLNRRLKAFKEVEEKTGFAKAVEMTQNDITADTDALNPNNQQIKEPAKW